MANYTLTIEAVPSDAIIKINEIEQASASIAEGAIVTYEVSAVGYNISNGSFTMPAEATTLSVTLTKGLFINFFSYAKARLSTLKPDELNLVDFSAPVEGIQALGVKNTDFNIDCSLGNIITFSVTASLSITLTPEASSGTCRIVTLVITNGGSHTISWPSSCLWQDHASPILTSDGVDAVTLMTFDNGNTWLGWQSLVNAS